MNTRVYLLISPEGHQLPGIVGCGESYINYEGPVSDLAIVTRTFIFYRYHSIRIPQDDPDDLMVPKSKTPSSLREKLRILILIELNPGHFFFFF